MRQPRLGATSGSCSPRHSTDAAGYSENASDRVRRDTSHNTSTLAEWQPLTGRGCARVGQLVAGRRSVQGCASSRVWEICGRRSSRRGAAMIWTPAGGPVGGGWGGGGGGAGWAVGVDGGG